MQMPDLHQGVSWWYWALSSKLYGMVMVVHVLLGVIWGLHEEDTRELCGILVLRKFTCIALMFIVFWYQQKICFVVISCPESTWMWEWEKCLYTRALDILP